MPHSSTSTYDIIIIGGSFSGLSAALTLARAVRRVLLIDAGKPCNRMAKYSHNLLGHDHENPAEIAAAARKQLLERYDTVHIVTDTASHLDGKSGDFTVGTDSGATYHAKKIIFASGVKDLMPETIPGFDKAWGHSILHCPYCHGYEVKDVKTAVLANGMFGSMMVKMVSHWNPEITLLTNGKSTIEDADLLIKKGIKIKETEIGSIDVDDDGQIQKVNFVDGSSEHFGAMYTRPDIKQACDMVEQIGCQLKDGLIVVDAQQKTSVPGVFACGDTQTMLRTLSIALSTGTVAAANCNMEIIMESFAQ